MIGAAGGPEKCQLVEKKGAFASIDYKSESIRTKAKELTGGEGVNVIFESVGGDTFKECLRWWVHGCKIDFLFLVCCINKLSCQRY